jgi:DnaJ-domain-containing protein 1
MIAFANINIQVNNDYKDLLFAIVFLIIIVNMMIFSYRISRNTSYSSNNSVRSNLPLNLLRACAADFILKTNYSTVQIISNYLQLLHFSGLKTKVELQYEKQQLEYLVKNNINTEHSIQKGVKEKHKNKLVIIAFFLNLYKSYDDETIIRYSDELRKKIRISDAVFEKILLNYVDRSHKKAENHFESINTKIKINKAYKTLKLEYGADLKKIKNAYRKLAKLYHPDSRHKEGRSRDSSGKFNEITEAYNILIQELSLK